MRGHVASEVIVVLAAEQAHLFGKNGRYLEERERRLLERICVAAPECNMGTCRPRCPTRHRHYRLSPFILSITVRFSFINNPLLLRKVRPQSEVSYRSITRFCHVFATDIGSARSEYH